MPARLLLTFSKGCEQRIECKSNSFAVKSVRLQDWCLVYRQGTFRSETIVCSFVLCLKRKCLSFYYFENTGSKGGLKTVSVMGHSSLCYMQSRNLSFVLEGVFQYTNTNNCTSLVANVKSYGQKITDGALWECNIYFKYKTSDVTSMTSRTFTLRDAARQWKLLQWSIRADVCTSFFCVRVWKRLRDI